MQLNRIKAGIKNILPWRIRYAIKLAEAKGYKIPGFLKFHNNLKNYTDAYYKVLRELGVGDLTGKTVCELGVGDFLVNAFLEYQMGAEAEYMLEIMDFVGVDSEVDINGYYKLRSPDKGGFVRKRKLPRIGDGETWKSYLPKINAHYLTNGLQGYKEIPSDSVDYVFSNAVFEHIRKREFVSTIEEVYRFMKTDGIMYNAVDFRDHIGGGKNQLRFPDDVWEDEDHYRMDNYTNRISCSEMEEILRKIGFRKIEIKRDYYDHIPLKRDKLAKEFASISDEDLFTRSAVIKAVK